MVDTSVKYFTSAMTGAPTLANVAGNLIAVLDACLVNGFGLKTCDSVVISSGVGTATISTGHSAIEQCVVLFAGATSPAALNGERKVTSIGSNTIVFDASGLPDGAATGTITVKLAPAGWTKAFAGTNLAAYKSANPAASGMFARFDDTTTTYASVRGYETMTDINAGAGIFPAAIQQAHSSWPKSNSAAAKSWWLVANDRCVYFGVAPSTSCPLNTLIFSFGDVIPRRTSDAYRFCLMSNTVDGSAQGGIAYSPVVAAGAYASSSGKYFPRSYAAIGVSVAVTLQWFGTNNQSMSGFGGGAFPNPADNALIMVPMYILEGVGIRGEMPGILATPQAIQANIVDGTIIKDIVGFDRIVVYRTGGYSNGNGTVGGVFFDLTGPWSS